MNTSRGPSELVIRPGGNDHQVIADLLAPGAVPGFPSGGRPPVARLVVDAHVAAKRPSLAQVAAGAGIPYLVDPLTHYLQGELRPTDSWATLPYGRAAAIAPEHFDDESARDDLVATTVDFEVEAGATAVIPPYFYADGPDDPWFQVTLDLLKRTASYMAQSGIRLPLLTVMCGQLQGFALEKTWEVGLDEFVRFALDTETSTIGMCLSPSGASTDAYSKLLRLFSAMERVASAGVPVIAWRQGVYGPALVAAGLAGYETGVGTSEQTNIAQNISRRRPTTDGKRRPGGAAPGVFLEPLGRSVPASIARALLGDLRMRAKVMCDDERCCPLGPASTLDHHRQHAIRARSRILWQLDEMPQRSWRLHRIARDSRGAATLIDQANKTLRDSGVTARLNSTSANSLATVAEHLTQRPLQQAR